MLSEISRNLCAGKEKIISFFEGYFNFRLLIYSLKIKLGTGFLYFLQFNEFEIIACV